MLIEHNQRMTSDSNERRTMEDVYNDALGRTSEPPSRFVLEPLGELVDPDSVLFSDWTWRYGEVGQTGQALLLTSDQLIHINFVGAPDAAHQLDSVHRKPGWLEVAYHAVKQLKSMTIKTKFMPPDRVYVVERCVAIHGDGWHFELPHESIYETTPGTYLRLLQQSLGTIN
jgi:hypothetical protein